MYQMIFFENGKSLLYLFLKNMIGFIYIYIYIYIYRVHSMVIDPT